MGILDLGYRRGGCGARKRAVERLRREAEAEGGWGIRWESFGLSSRSPEKIGQWSSPPVPHLFLSIGGASPLRKAQLPRIRKAGRALAERVWLEVCGLSEALAAEAAGFDGVVVRGHEAGGRVGMSSSFILLQELHGRLGIPYLLWGGIGLGGAAAAEAAGASGVVLSEALWLTEEGPYARPEQRPGGKECEGAVGAAVGGEEIFFRLFSRTGPEPIRILQEEADRGGIWWRKLAALLEGSEDGGLFPLGQEIAFAPELASTYGTVGRVLEGLRASLARRARQALSQRALGEGSALATAHRTRFPIVQGPMTRVSDTPAFARSVARAGGLPFLALAVLRREAVRSLLLRTADALEGLPWGVGLLGFLPPEYQEEQMEAIEETRPPFALLAGARMSQIRRLEGLGITTYAHVPSPEILRGFFQEGHRHFILEGSECGGHTGPRTSFVLWEKAILLLATEAASSSPPLRVLFAGGIHDALSAAMVSVLAAPLVEREGQIGVLMGTAYLFTREVVRDGAIVREFQRQAAACRRTALLPSGTGVWTRCARTPFCTEFLERRRRLLLAGTPKAELLRELELLNVGRLRIAAKGITRSAVPEKEGTPPGYVSAPLPLQRKEGLYMLGEAARLRREILTVEELHRTVSVDSYRKLEQAVGSRRVGGRKRGRGEREPIAIIGMACLFPGAEGIRSFWGNILGGRRAIREVDPARWRPEEFFSGAVPATERVASKWGGFLEPLLFDPIRYGIPPASVPSIEPVQLLALEVAARALADAGLHRRPFARERTATIFGAGGIPDLAAAYVFRALIRHYLGRLEEIPQELREKIERRLLERELPLWTPDSFPGILSGVLAGRIASRLDLGGASFSVDAACASALASVRAGMEELRNGRADFALVGAADTNNNVCSFVGFTQSHALSPEGESRPFDAAADGIVLGEGVAAVVLRRAKDAEREGDRIYALLRACGSSSDGRNRSLTAPHLQGQLAAIERAFREAEIDPASLGLIEAHGTGTSLGDRIEIEALKRAFARSEALPASCAIGSVKSMIGHTKIAAGMAGLLKGALALHQRVLPPTLGVDRPNPALRSPESPFYLPMEPRPWLADPEKGPRRCGVSAFGFGGSNFHLVLEEYRGAFRAADRIDLAPRERELFFFSGNDPQQIFDAIERLLHRLPRSGIAELGPLAGALFRADPSPAGRETPPFRLALLAASLEELRGRLLAWQSRPGWPMDGSGESEGCYWGSGSGLGGLCVLFPGQGSQRVGMLAELAVASEDCRERLEWADRALRQELPQPLSRYLFPPATFSAEERSAREEALNASRVAQPALAAVELAGLSFFSRYGFEADCFSGHSFGEYAALCAAAALPPEELLRLAAQRGRIIDELVAKGRVGAMAAVGAPSDRVRELLPSIPSVWVAAANGPRQTTISGTVEGIERALEELRRTGIPGKKLGLAFPFHSGLAAEARAPLAQSLAQISFSAPRKPVFSGGSASPYPSSRAGIRALLLRQIEEPVCFVETIEALYRAGIRAFFECGPGATLTGFVRKILADRPHLAFGLDPLGRPFWQRWGEILARCFAAGVRFRSGAWFEGRGLPELSLEDFRVELEAREKSESRLWRIDGGRAVRLEADPTTRSGSRRAESGGDEIPRLPFEENRCDTKAPMKKNDSPSEPSSEPILGDHSASSPADPPPPPDPAASSRSSARELQATLRQLIELQREQQRTLRRFLDLFGPSLANSAEVGPLEADGEADHHRGHAEEGLGVPPAPVLPPFPRESAFRSAPGEPKTPFPRGEEEAAPRQNGISKNREEFGKELVREVVEATGYPEEMVRLDADMEAELGIDSIKRAEIFYRLRRRYPLLAEQEEEWLFAELGSRRTLEEILRWHDELLSKAGPLRRKGAVAQARPTLRLLEGGDSEDGPRSFSTARYVVRALEARPEESGDKPPPTARGSALLIGRASPLVEGVARLLAQSGVEVYRLLPGRASRQLSAKSREESFSTARSLREARQWIEGASSPLKTLFFFSSPSRDEAEHAAEAREFFLALQAWAEPLRKTGGCWIVPVTSLDGKFGLGGGGNFAASSGALPALAKTAAREWPEVRVKCIDFDPELDPEEAGFHLLSELACGDPAIEVGFTPIGRWTLRLEEAPLAPSGPLLPLDPESVVVAVGGAYGIGAYALQALAAKYRPTLILLGRSAPPGVEVQESSAVGPADRKALLLRRLRSERPELTPVQAEHAWKASERKREIERNLAALRAAGSRVLYRSIDARDAAAFRALLQEIYRSEKRIDGVIHVAGIVEDRLLQEKRLASFERIYETKVSPALTLARELRPEGLRFLAFFSSAAARFGNPGQCDYGAGNEVLNKLAQRLSVQWPGVRTVSLGWGPWEGGMVAEELGSRFAKRGIGLIPPTVGSSLFLREIEETETREAEIVVAAGKAAMGSPISGRLSPEREG
ncbi:type I polyketide synthase [Methylacidimicrobium cyclopophantes]|uniref:type I polyketide synthase n=1 Tax=Methylacidimicrobium cyclopophantes TaxID=1041766 RepID=UPI001C497CBD|nr:type I polyketide synthase [Methylacidimicrobium cyclopophantes]